MMKPWLNRTGELPPRLQEVDGELWEEPEADDEVRTKASFADDPLELRP
jgi:hypothetical protein